MQKFKEQTDLDMIDRIKSASITGAASVADPIVELSFLQGISNLFSAARYNETALEKFGAVMGTVVTDYLNQWIPAVLGKGSRVADDTERDTSSTKTGFEGQWQRGFVNQAKNKLWSSSLNAKTDTWGETISKNDTPTVEATSSIFGDNEFGKGVGRLLDAISPTKITEIKDLDNTEKAILDVYQKTHSKVLPTQKQVDKTISVDSEEYRLDDDEYNKAKEIFGSKSKELLDAFVSSDGYKSLEPSEKAKIMNNIYLCSKQNIKEYYCKKHDLEFEPTDNASKDMFNSISAIEKAGGSAKDYFNYLTGTQGMDNAVDRLKYLNNMKLKQEVKNIIYEKDVATYEARLSGDDENYQTLQAISGGKTGKSKSYLEYKQKSKENYFTNKNDVAGKKDVDGQKQKRLKEFLKNSDLSGLERMYIYAKEGYACKKDGTGLNASQRLQLFNAIENSKVDIDSKSYDSIINELIKAEGNAKKWGQSYNKEILKRGLPTN